MRPRIELDYYAILGVTVAADGAQIQKAYRRRAKRCHPDVFPIGSADRVRAESQFKVLSEAREVLLDARMRAIYDSQRPQKVMEDYVPPYPMDIPPPAAGPYHPPDGRRTSQTSRFNVNLTFGDALKIAEADAEAAEANPGACADEDEVENTPVDKRLERADYYFDRGWKYARYGRIKMALECFRQAAHLDPSRKIPLWLHLYQRRKSDQDGW